ncbi:hypothetical protein EON65_48560, partial [archaeon]
MATLTSSSAIPFNSSSSMVPEHPPYPVIAVTVMVYQPRWFQRRYSLMVQNIFNNVPPGVKIQIFHGHDKDTLAGLEMSRSIQDMHSKGVIILTPIPPDLL